MAFVAGGVASLPTSCRVAPPPSAIPFWLASLPSPPRMASANKREKEREREIEREREREKTEEHDFQRGREREEASEWLACGVAAWPPRRVAGWLSSWMACSDPGWLLDCLSGWPGGWLAGGLAHHCMRFLAASSLLHACSLAWLAGCLLSAPSPIA